MSEEMIGELNCKKCLYGYKEVIEGRINSKKEVVVFPTYVWCCKLMQGNNELENFEICDLFITKWKYIT